MRSLATPGWGPPAAVVCGCLPLLGVVLVTVPRHCWLGSAGRGGGCLRGVAWGFLVVFVFVARCVRAWCLCWCVCRAFVVAWVWVCLPCVLVCVCVCVCVCGCVAGAGWGLPLVWVWVWLVCAMVGPSPLLAEVPECNFLPLLAGFRCRRWWVLLATPG